MRTQSWDALGDRPKVGWMFGPTSGRMHELRTYIRSHDSGAHVFGVTVISCQDLGCCVHFDC